MMHMNMERRKMLKMEVMLGLEQTGVVPAEMVA